MLTLRQMARLIAIQRVFIRHGFDEIIFAMHLFRPVRYLRYLLPWNWWGRDYGPRAVRMRLAIEDLGPIFVKFGQILSTRQDLLPGDIAAELEKLQDSVPPFPGREARKIVEEAYGKRIEEVFAEFNEVPLASASIAQVHAARLKDGREVIVKVIRPGIEKNIRSDLGIMRFLAEKTEQYRLAGNFLRLTGVVDEFERTIIGELDMMREAANASQLRRNFRNEPRYYVPEIVWSLTRRNVLVMERVSGIPVNDVEGLKRAGVDLKWLSGYGVEIFFIQVFRDSFFHADMHPGNIFVSPPAEDRPARVMVVDFGIMSSLTEFDQRYLAENLLAFLNRDYQLVAELHVESGWVPPGTRVDEFEAEIRAVCEPLFDRPLKEISFGDLLLRLLQTARRFNMEILPQLLLLQKTIVNIEGVGRQLYPELDLWEAARPQLERWISERMGLRGLWRGTKENLPHWMDRLPHVPAKIIDLMDRLRDGKIQLENNSKDIRYLREEMRTYNRRTVLSVIGSGALMSSAIVYGLGGDTPYVLAGAPLVSWVAGAMGFLLLILAFKE
ncbi:MAG: ubiquinone biosynthesis regulatory protein kinase UbiB [Gammaproteobacteria bacterium]|jgi:ubiquinone biosynthesis protein|nr:MAG: ubiquinone biosynthesis regulatory protein kinase UbiB [Gammaproteobacteria bacterium]